MGGRYAAAPLPGGRYAAAVLTAELVERACPVVGDRGWAYYFAKPTLAAGRALGLQGLPFYVIGRGGALGDVPAGVVASAFGYFNPTLVAELWESARTLVAPAEAAAVHFGCAADFGRERFGELPALGAFCAAAGAVNDAADPTGLPLYAGFRAQPLVDDEPGRAMQLLAVLRELRGSAHLLAVRACGLSPRTAHYLDHPDQFALFGWTEADVPEIGAREREARRASEVLTDELVAPAYGALDDAQAGALLDGLEAITAALSD